RYSLKKILHKCGNLYVDLEEVNGKKPVNIYCNYRDVGDKMVLFICNISKNENYSIQLRLNDGCHIEEWNAVTGDKIRPNTSEINGYRYVNLNFQPVESHLLVIDRSEKIVSQSLDQQAANEKLIERIDLHSWKTARLDYNIMTLNKC